MSWLCARRIVAPTVAGVAVLFTVGVLAAHDFWIVPDAFQVAAGATVEIRGQSGVRFPISQNATAPERVAEARLVGAASDERLSDLSVSGKSLLIRHRPTAPGQRIVAVTLAPRSSRTTPERLKRYLALEGAPELAERYTREDAYPKSDSVTQIAGKFAKTIVEVGRDGPRAFSRPVGHALELVPANDPAALRAGGMLTLRLLYHGRPVAGAHLRAGAAPPGITATSDSVPPSVPAGKDVVVETEADGTARIPLSEPGLWNVRTLYGAPAPGSSAGAGASWEVFFATLVFSVAGGSEPQSGPQGDGAEVAATVARFHAALAAGDSASALGLLADDLVILESGGAETRDEFRSGHLAADIAYARAVTTQRDPPRVRVRGDVAWASTASTSQGEYRGRPIDSRGVELMVLSREPEGWKIRAIHWSSRTRRP